MKHVPHVENTDDIIDIFLINRESRVVCFLHNEIQCFLKRDLPVQRKDSRAVRHDIRRHFIIELEDIRDHLRLTGL